MNAVVQKIESLSPELQQQVEDFVDFIRLRRPHSRRGVLRQGWGGGLRDLRDDYTALELQKKALE